jgi:protoporphyrinogen oxidase
MPVSNTEDLLVVGAGISGLGMARMAKRRGLKPLVVEAGEHIGGAINTCLFEQEEGKFWAELGAHTCYNSYGHFLQLLEESKQLDALTPKRKLRYRIQSDTRLHTIPSQLNIFELLGVLPRLWLNKKEGRSVEDYFGSVIGRQNYNSILGPALDAVVCQPAGKFPADALFRKKPRRKEVMRSYTGSLGLQSFINGIKAGLNIQNRTPVISIDRTAKDYRVILDSGDKLETKRLVLAVAPDVAATLLNNQMPELAARLSEIKMADIESQAVLVRSDQLELPALAGIIGRKDDFFSTVSRDLVPDEHYRGFTFHFKPGRLDEAGRLTRIAKVLGIGEEAIVETRYCHNRLPSLRLGHAERIAWIDQALQGYSLGLTGNWFSGISIEDSLIRSHEECQRLCA